MKTPRDQDLTEATRQLAALSAAGLPLASGLRALATEAPRSGLRNLFEQLAQRLEKGIPLHEALASLPNLPEGLSGIVQLGQQTGRPDFFVPEFLENRQELDRLYVRLLATFLYPSLLVLVFLMLIMSGIGNFLGNVFVGFGITLPVITEVVVSVCKWTYEHRGLLSSLLGIVGVALILAWLPRYRNPSLRLMAMVVPYVGKAVSHRATAGFCRMLAGLLESRVPLPIALRAAGDACGSPSLRKSSARLASAAEQGQDVEQTALTDENIFPDLAHALRWTRDGDRFTTTLRDCAELHHRQSIASRGLSTMLLANVGLSLIPIAMGFGVLLVYAAFFLPLIQLLNNLS